MSRRNAYGVDDLIRVREGPYRSAARSQVPGNNSVSKF